MSLVSVLIIDDEDDICFLLGNVLRGKKYEVTIANNLADGLGLISKMKPSVLFLDVRLPDGSGLDSVQSIRKQNPLMKIVMMSAYDDMNTRRKAIESGADLFIGKPLNMELIELTLKAIQYDQPTKLKQDG